MSNKIVLSKSNTHELEAISKNQDNTEILMVMNKSCLPNQDFHFCYSMENFHLPKCIVGTSSNSTTAMISFIPKFCDLSIDDAYRASILKGQTETQTDITTAKGEYIFLLDRSGSMEGNRIEKAKEALILFLKSLPQDSFFNICSFGSTYQYLSGSSLKNTKKNITKAVDQIKNMKANLGGTKIFQPLNSIFVTPIKEGYPRNVFLLTDGCVRNTQAIVYLIQRNTNHSRVHSIGVGNGASSALIEESAKAGNGKFIMISDAEDPSQKIITLLQSALSPVIENLKLEIANNIIESIVPNPKSLPFILKNDTPNFYITFKFPLKQKVACKISYTDTVNKLPYCSQLQINPASLNQPAIDKMAHLKVLKNLEKSIKNGVIIDEQMHYVKVKDPKQQAINYSIKHQVLSSLTAYLCVRKVKVDGKYEQFIEKGTQTIKIRQMMPIEDSIAKKTKSRARQQTAAFGLQKSKCQEQRNSDMRFEHRMVAGMNYPSSTTNLKKMDMRIQQEQDLVYQKKKVKKVEAKKMKNEEFSKQLHTPREQKATHRPMKNTGCAMKSANSHRKIQTIAKQVEEKNRQDALISILIEMQNPNGSWSDRQALHIISFNDDTKCLEKWIKLTNQEFVITKLVLNWLVKNYSKQKQYSLIIKKGEAWIKKSLINAEVDEELSKVVWS